MLLMNTICAEVTQIPGYDKWFQMTGKNIYCNQDVSAAAEIRIAALEDLAEVVPGARVLGIQNAEDVEIEDPRFNRHSNHEFAVISEGEGRFRMVLDINLAEYAILRLLVPSDNGPYDDAEEYELQDGKNAYLDEYLTEEAKSIASYDAMMAARKAEEAAKAKA
jgi:hypothetical protein